MAADYRIVQTRMWREDEWFQSIETDAKLLFVYLFTNPSASVSGIYRLPIRTMAFESGLTLNRVAELMAQFAAAEKAFYGNGVVWVRKMREGQLVGKISPQLMVKLEKDLSQIPMCDLKIRYLKAYGYPIDTVSIPPLNSTGTGTGTETGTETEKGASAPADAAPTPPEPKRKPSPDYPQPVQVFIANGGAFPTGKLPDGTTKKERAIQYITECIKNTPESLVFWGQVVAGYCLQWSSKSYTVMINDYYLNGRLPAGCKPNSAPNGNGKSSYAADRPDPEMILNARIKADRAEKEAEHGQPG